MKIDLTPSQGDAPARASPQALQFRLRNLWLRELEQAQLGWWSGDRRAPSSDRAQDSANEDPRGRLQGEASASERSAPRLSASSCAILADLRAHDEAGAADAGEAARTPRAEDADANAESGRRPARTTGDPDRLDKVPAADRFLDPLLPQAAPTTAVDARVVSTNALDPATKTSEAPRSAPVAPAPLDRQWPARSVHMMMDASGAKVWIRDAGLADGSTSHILSSLAADLAQRSTRLRALTVNGRLVFEAEPAPASGHEIHIEAADGRARQDSNRSESVFEKATEVDNHGNR